MYKYRIPLSVDSLIDYEFLKRLNKIEINDMYERIPYWGEEIVSEKFQQFMDDGLIKICDNYEVLQCLKVSELKDILRAFNLKLAGNKHILIDRIKGNVPKEKVPVPYEYAQCIIRTDFGEEIYNKLLCLKEKEFDKLVDDMVESIENSDFDNVNKIMCKYEAKQPFQRGLFVGFGLKQDKRKFNKYGIDVTYWNNHLKNGFSNNEIEVYKDALDECSWNIIGILHLCLSIMLGMSYNKSIQRIKRYIERHDLKIDDEEISEYNNFITKVYIKRDLAQLINSNISRYKILGCKDGSCSICSHMNGQIFYVSEAREGITLPPFCNDCRCTIVADY